MKQRKSIAVEPAGTGKIMKRASAKSVVTTTGSVTGGREVTPKEFYEWIRNTIKNESGVKSRDEYADVFRNSEQAKGLLLHFKEDDVHTLINKAVKNAKDRTDWSGKVRDYTCHRYALDIILPIAEDRKKRMSKDIMTNNDRAVQLGLTLKMHHTNEYRELCRLASNDEQSVHKIIVGVVNKVYGRGDIQWVRKSEE